jgi:hypothetical protein
MSDTQLYLAIGIPSLLVVLNIIQSNRLGDKIDRVTEQLSAKIDRIAEQQSAKMDRLAEQQHKDSLTLQGYMVPLHERMAVIETKQK